MSFPIFLAFTISLLTFGCSINRAASDNLLEKRSDYSGKDAQSKNLREIKGNLIQPKRTKTETVDILVHPHELAGGDYFLGGWIRAIVTQPRWDLDQEDIPIFEPVAQPIEFPPVKK